MEFSRRNIIKTGFSKDGGNSLICLQKPILVSVPITQSPSHRNNLQTYVYVHIPTLQAVAREVTFFEVWRSFGLFLG